MFIEPRTMFSLVLIIVSDHSDCVKPIVPELSKASAANPHGPLERAFAPAEQHLPHWRPEMSASLGAHVELTLATILVAFAGVFLICFMKGAFGGGFSIV